MGYDEFCFYGSRNYDLEIEEERQAHSCGEFCKFWDTENDECMYRESSSCPMGLGLI